jgi:hypothetical protein
LLPSSGCQLVDNACASQAILSIILNSPEVDLGKDVANFKEFCQGFSSIVRERLAFHHWIREPTFPDPSIGHPVLQNRGLAIGNFELLRKAHNGFAKYVTCSLQNLVLAINTFPFLTKRFSLSFFFFLFFGSGTLWTRYFRMLLPAHPGARRPLLLRSPRLI